MASDQLFASGTRVGRPPAGHLTTISVVFVAGLALTALVSMGMLRELSILLIGTLVIVVTWKYPVPAAVFLIAFTSVNRFVIFLGFYFVSSPMALRGMQLWKDEIVLILLVRVVHDALSRRQAPRVYILDILIGAFVALNLLYVAYPGTIEDSSLIGRLLGFRLDAYFLLAYFVGRGLTLKRHHVRWLILALIPGSTAVALVAGYQWVFPDSANALWNSLGYMAFVDAVGGSSDIAVRTRDIAGVSIPRASSLLMGDLALAFYQLLLVPIAAALFFVQRKGWAQLASGAFLLLMLGTLAMSGARSAIVAVPVALLVMTFWTVAYPKAIAMGATVLTTAVIGLVVVTGGISLDWFSGLASPGEGSTVAHADAMRESIEIIKAEPLGRGLGTSHTVGYQLGVRESFANESWYLQIASETGILGLFLYSLVIAGASVAPFIAFLRVRDPWLRVLTLGVGGAGISFLLVGIVLHVWEAPVIAAAFWLLAGVAVRAPDLERQWEEEETAAEKASSVT